MIADKSQNDKQWPLEGVKVLDLGQIYNGPYAGFLMAHAGADVIKVEPLTGEVLRQRGGGQVLPFPCSTQISAVLQLI